jgi:hypothetical protein
MKRILWKLGLYLLTIVLMVLGYHLLSVELFLLGLLLFVLFAYLDGNGEFFPNHSWQKDANGRRYRITGAGRNLRIEYHIGDTIDHYLSTTPVDQDDHLPPS